MITAARLKSPTASVLVEERGNKAEAAQRELESLGVDEE